MEMTTLCTVVVSLRLVPSRTQFFMYESVSLSCEGQGNPSNWRVKRNTSKKFNQDCPSYVNTAGDSTCRFENLYEADSGVYWCESGDGQVSVSINITVTGGLLILESPERPLDEGEALTLHCRTSPTSFSNLTHFYKDDLLIGSSSTGNFTIQSVSKRDEGNYACKMSGVKGESPSPGWWLTVRARRPGTPTAPLKHILLPVAGTCLLLIVLLLLLRLRRSHKGRVDRAVSYTDVIITEEGNPRTICDVGADPTFYSTVKSESS